MLHLLPDTQKKRVLKEYRMRIVAVVFILITLLSIAGVVLLLPSYLSAVGSLNLVKNGNKIKQSSIESLKGSNFDDKLKNVDYGVKALKITQQIPGSIETYNNLNEDAPAGVVINKYFYTLTDDKNASVGIDGIAQDRETLIAFQNKLKEHKEFQGIEIPISSFTKKKDINFSIKFNLIKVDK